MNRRNFIKNTLATSTLISLGELGLSSFSSFQETKITILHTNDVHSHIDPFPKDHPKYANLGGIVNRARVIENIRSNEKNVLLLDAGDIFQGTPYFNYFNGKLEYELMSKLKYDVATLGNHDFDNGIQGILQNLPFATFSFVNCNYDFRNSELNKKINSYKIIIKDGIKIGITGVGIDLNGLVDKMNYQNITYSNPIDKLNETTNHLKNEENCNLIICLSHLGYKYNDNKISDIKLAENTSNIDLIIGGHTHTFLEKPTLLKNKDNKPVLINQVGAYGLHLGKIDFYFSNNKKYMNLDKNILIY